MTSPSYSSLLRHWGIDPTFTFLNHGSFGATPLVVLEKQNQLRKQMEAQLVRFFIRDLEPLWDEARKITAEFLGADPGDLVFVKNTTMGVNTVFRTIPMKKGDEVLFHSHVYGACLHTMRQYADQKGFEIKVAPMPWPVLNEEEIIRDLEAGITPASRLLFIDHITSSTGLIYPIEKITKLFKSKGIDVFVDGAHAPGMLDLNIAAIGADYYVGNAHKWICSPKGSAILWVHPSKQAHVKPLQWSHVYDRDAAWAKGFFWPGTDDYTACLCIPEALNFMGSLFPGGWKELRQHNRELILKGRKLIADAAGVALPAPDNMIGHLATIPVASTTPPEFGFNYIPPLQEELYTKYHIEVPVFVFPKEKPMLSVRPAAQAYNHISQYEYLAEAIKKIIRK